MSAYEQQGEVWLLLCWRERALRDTLVENRSVMKCLWQKFSLSTCFRLQQSPKSLLPHALVLLLILVCDCRNEWVC